MPPTRTRSSEISASRRTITRAKELWIDYYHDALNSLLSTDSERVKEYTQEEADMIAESARRIADAALAQTENRFPGL
jgi:hypothetical protein